MIGKDLVKYHNYIHGPVHYTTSVSAIGTPELSAYGLTRSAALTSLSGTTADGVAAKEYPFQGHMFIQGCVSATGWLDDNGNCTKLAKVALSGCRRVSICGDHMQGALHMSRLILTNNPDLSGYDFRNAEICFDLDKSTFKTIVIDYNRPYSSALHIHPTKIKPGCVSTLKLTFSPDAKTKSSKLTFHPGMKWLTQRPTFIHQKFEGYLSLESYGDTIEDVYCSYREECLEVCPEVVCRSDALTGFDSFEGDKDQDFDPQLGEPLSGCGPPLQFKSWVDDCMTTYKYTLSTGEEKRLLFKFDDYYFEDGGTRLWNWTGEVDKLTDQPIGHWYYNNSGVNNFQFKQISTKVPDEWIPPDPVLEIYRGDYNDRNDTPVLSTLVYTSSAILEKDDPYVMYLPAKKMYAVRFTREFGTRYLVVLRCPEEEPIVNGTFMTTCPFRYIASRYVPK